MQVLNWQESNRKVSESPQATKIVATKDIQVGSTISFDDLIELINAPVGDKELGSLPLFVNSKAEVVGRSAKRRIPAGSVVTQEDIEPQ